ncbi:MAG: hypothetical protein JNJ88_20065 [Planctomycetes bacterium]|nr:hypothetical protein [Planctomycetota bacterium]
MTMPPKSPNEDIPNALLSLLPKDGNEIGSTRIRELLNKELGRNVSDEEYMSAVNSLTASESIRGRPLLTSPLARNNSSQKNEAAPGDTPWYVKELVARTPTKWQKPLLLVLAILAVIAVLTIGIFSLKDSFSFWSSGEPSNKYKVRVDITSTNKGAQRCVGSIITSKFRAGAYSSGRFAESPTLDLLIRDDQAVPENTFVELILDSDGQKSIVVEARATCSMPCPSKLRPNGEWETCATVTEEQLGRALPLNCTFKDGQDVGFYGTITVQRLRP